MFVFGLSLVLSYAALTVGVPLTTPQPLEPAPTLVVNASHAPVDWTQHAVWKFESSNGKPAFIPKTKPTVANLGEEILEFVKEEDDLEKKLREKASSLKKHSRDTRDAPIDTFLLTTELPTTLDYNTRGPFEDVEGTAFTTSAPPAINVPSILVEESLPEPPSTTPQVEYVSVAVETTPSFKRLQTVPETTTFLPAVALLERERASAYLSEVDTSFAPVFGSKNSEVSTTEATSEPRYPFAAVEVPESVGDSLKNSGRWPNSIVETDNYLATEAEPQRSNTFEPAKAQNEDVIPVIKSQAESKYYLPEPTRISSYRGSKKYSQSAPLGQEFNSDSDGSFNFGYETDQGTKVKSIAYYKKALVPQYDNRGRKLGDEEMDVLVQEGSYTYILPDGQTVFVTYIADENGYRITNQSFSK